MHRVFENPSNGYREELSDAPAVWVTLFGFFYLLYKGLWSHALIWFLIVIIPAAISGGPLLILSLPITTVVYICTIKRLLSSQYLRRGWKEITSTDTEPAKKTPDLVTNTFMNRKASAPEAEASSPYRKCPFCAEDVRREAVKCKHCHSDLPPIQQENSPHTKE
ncbi:DUF2628 domain-containing protein [Rugamonas sp. DEMB1]|uniref:DUF2628 domain-containing protein n=1 Tax=Rugamonas sp. DEMB1 TaxID=3039386 RepID=UPI00391BCF3D